MQQYFVINIIETPFNIPFNKPCGSRPCFGDDCQCCMTTTLWAKTVRELAELRLVIGLKDHTHDLLEQLITPCWQAKRTHFPVLFLNIDPSGWGELIVSDSSEPY